MSARVETIVLIGILAAVPAWAMSKKRATVGKFDELAAAKAQCLSERSAQRLKDMGSGIAGSCTKLTSTELGYDGTLKEEFCKSPEQFCKRVRGLSEEERESKAVNARCEPMMSLDSLGPLDPKKLEMDSHFAEMMVQSWGCTSMKNEVTPSDKGPALWLEYDCDPSRMPFRCDGNGDAIPAPGEKESAAPLRAYGAQLRTLPGGKCQIYLGKQLPKGYPEPVGSEDPYEDYVKRASGHQKDLDQLNGELAVSATKMFTHTASLLGTGSQHFADGARAVLTPERVVEAKRMWEIAQRSVVAALSHMSPPAPVDVLDRIKSTAFMDTSKLTRTPPDQEAMDSFQEKCDVHPSSHTAFGVWNAFNSPGTSNPLGFKGSPNTMVVCPDLLLEADLSDPQAMIPVFEHELGHSVDPCGMSRLLQDKAEKDAGYSSCAPLSAWTSKSDADADTHAAEDLKYERKTKAFADCLYSHSDMGHGTVVRKEGGEVGEFFRALVSSGLDVDDLDKCDALQHSEAPLGSGIASSCGMNTDFLIKDVKERIKEAKKKGVALSPDKEKALLAAAEKMRDAQHDRANEATADYISAISLPYAMQDPEYSAPPLNELSPSEQSAEVTTLLGDVCHEHSSEKDEHPDADFRLSNYASIPAIRSIAHCSGGIPNAGQNGGQFPEAACSISGEKGP